MTSTGASPALRRVSCANAAQRCAAIDADGEILS
jgi:hypothetical protein